MYRTVLVLVLLSDIVVPFGTTKQYEKTTKQYDRPITDRCYYSQSVIWDPGGRNC